MVRIPMLFHGCFNFRVQQVELFVHSLEIRSFFCQTNNTGTRRKKHVGPVAMR